MGFIDKAKTIFTPGMILAAMVLSLSLPAAPASASVPAERSSNIGIIKGVVRDHGGSPIADATVAFFRVGTSKLLKQVRSRADGSFLAKIMPGTYTVLAVAQGFNAVTVDEVEVNRAAELVYGFKLERAGSGNTLPEKRTDRRSSKWHIRAAQMQRSIYQSAEGEEPAPDEIEIAETEPEEESRISRKPQAVMETYFASTDKGSYTGLNAAARVQLSEDADIVVAGQTGTGNIAPQRFETTLRFKPVEDHRVSMTGSVAKLGTVEKDGVGSSLGQVSFQALDQWSVREGIVLVFGLDYSKFFGAGGDFSISPRLGFQFDIDHKTRFRTAYTTKTEEKSWARAIELEDAQVVFQEPVAMSDLVMENGRPQMNKSSRFEIGIERILDNSSSIEANAFFDSTLGRGVGLINMPFSDLGGEGMSEFVSNQQGSASGLRVVYSRRINGMLSTSGGYAFGSGQKLTEAALAGPADVFENAFFQTVFGEVQADLKTGTSVRTIFRFSPQATVFAIDPFQGRLAIYDPSLSVFVTQSLPNLGLPFDAQAVVDARNIFDFQTGVTGHQGSLRLNSQGRALRGGIRVRF